MKSKFFGVLFALTVVFGGCTYHSQTKGSPDLFCSKKIQDSLELFISGLPSLENEYGAPTKTIINIWTDSKGDTMIMFCAHYHLKAIGPPPAEYSQLGADTAKWVGAAILDTMICPVSLTKIDSIPAFINQSALTIQREDYDFFHDDSLECRELPCIEAIPLKIYLLNHTDSLELIYFRDWPSKDM